MLLSVSRLSAPSFEANAKGEIELEAVDPKTAKSQIYGLPGGKPYTLGTVARFLNLVTPSDGQATKACRVAFDAYRQKASTAEALASIPSIHHSERVSKKPQIRCRRPYAKTKGLHRHFCRPIGY